MHLVSDNSLIILHYNELTVVTGLLSKCESCMSQMNNLVKWTGSVESVLCTRSTELFLWTASIELFLWTGSINSFWEPDNFNNFCDLDQLILWMCPWCAVINVVTNYLLIIFHYIELLTIVIGSLSQWIKCKSYFSLNWELII